MNEAIAAKYLSGAKGDYLRAKKKRKIHSSAQSGSLAIIDADAGLDSFKQAKDDLEEATVVEARSKASFKPINPDAIKAPSPEPEGSEEEPTIVGPPVLKGGLQTAAQLAAENAKRKRHEERVRKKALKEQQAAGITEETVYRDSTGRARDTKKEKAEARRQERADLEKQMAKMEWGKGLVQREDKERRKREEEAMAAKPVARYADDDDLNDQQKSEMRWNDPAARFLSKSSSKPKTTRPTYKGPVPPPNRFGIPPGYRWDGVDRSNGWERRFLGQANEQKVKRDAAYKWSVDDM